MGRISNDVHSHCLGHASDLPADATVAEDTEASPDSIANSVERGLAGVFAPFVLGLKGVKEIISAKVNERREDDPEKLANDLKQKRHAIHHSAMVGP